MTALIKHPHAELIVERARQDAFGELEAGWWAWEYRSRPYGLWTCYVSTFPPTFGTAFDYQYTMTDKHPDYVAPKPKLRLIDMSELPKGTMVQLQDTYSSGDYSVHGPYKSNLGLLAIVRASGLGGGPYEIKHMRIIEQKEFTFWGGGECPVPEGVVCEVVTRRGQVLTFTNPIVQAWTQWGSVDVIGYRIIGVAGGWTDNPESAT